MPTFSFPVLLWKNSAGIHTASLVESAAPVAVAMSAKSALEQLRSLLEWQYRQDPSPPLPELRDPQLVEYRVSVRPEYQDAQSGRRYPVSLPVEIRVHCVLGTQSADTRLAALPIPGLRLQLTRYDEPDEVSLELIHVTVQSRPHGRRTILRPLHLENTAEPLGNSSVRSLLGPALERQNEVREFAASVYREKGSWLLVGETGCGKTTVLCDAAREIERRLGTEQKSNDEALAPLRPARRFWQTSAGRIISGMKYLGEWQERLESMIEDLAAIDGVLCIESLAELLRTGGREASDSRANCAGAEPGSRKRLSDLRNPRGRAGFSEAGATVRTISVLAGISRGGCDPLEGTAGKHRTPAG